MKMESSMTTSTTGPPGAKKVKLETDVSGKLLLTTVQPAITSGALMATPIVSSVNTTCAPTVLNFTFSNGELRPCAGPGPVTAQMTVTSRCGDVVSNPALAKPIIVTLSGLPTVPGKPQQITIPTSSVLGQPLQAVTSCDKIQLTPNLTTTSAASILSALSSALPNVSSATQIPIVVAAAPPVLTKGTLGTPSILSVTPISTAQLQSATVSTATSCAPPSVTMAPIMISQAPLFSTPILGSFLGSALATTAAESFKPQTGLDSSVGVGTSTSSKTDPTSPDFDPIQAMDWKDGVATLPGSNIKFKLNEFGTLEVITEASSIMPESVVGISEKKAKIETSSVPADSSNGSNSTWMAKNKSSGRGDDDANTSCENCGCLGRRENFVGDRKRFCGQTCLSVNSTRRAVHQRQKEILLKKKRRKLLPFPAKVPPTSILAAVSVVPITSTIMASSTITSSVPTNVASLVTTLASPIASVVPLNPAATSHDAHTNNRAFSPQSTNTDELSKVRLEENAPSPGGKNKKGKVFVWAQYLELEKAEAASVKSFRETQNVPFGKNPFKTGMKLEGIDPRHPSLFCVLSVAEIVGYRLRLHFDGYSDCYDFWANADSIDIFPVGFCEKTGRVLQPPKGYQLHEFEWTKYLQSSRSIAAPKHLFSYRNAQSVTPHGFRVGMKLEAVDKKNSSLVCVATVTDVLDNRFLVHFDGWEDMYDYWVEPNSPYIHPVNWCLDNGHVLTPPNNYKDPEKFSWTRYLSETKSVAVPSRSFKQRSPNTFKGNTKIEAVDRRNPMLIRVATIADVRPHSIKVHFDGWSDAYDYWLDDDSPDIHPVSWCSKTSHRLQPPINATEVGTENGGCPTPGCQGVGHIKGPKYTTHHSAFGCPYSYANMNKEMALQDRTGTARQESVVLAVLPNTSEAATTVGTGMVTTMTSVDSQMGRKTESNVSESLRRCPTPGCNGSGHVTGKYTVHHRVSGCPLAAIKREAADRANGLNVPVVVKSTRGRKRTRFPLPSMQLKGKDSPYNEGSVASSPSSVSSSQHSEDSKPVLVKESLRSSVHRSVFSGLPGGAPPPAPDKEMPYRWDQHSQLLPGVIQILGSNVCKWSIENVASFITSLTGCPEQGKIFKDEQIDGEAFLLLNQADIVKILSVKLGPALKIFNSILLFRKTTDC